MHVSLQLSTPTCWFVASTNTPLTIHPFTKRYLSQSFSSNIPTTFSPKRKTPPVNTSSQHGLRLNAHAIFPPRPPLHRERHPLAKRQSLHRHRRQPRRRIRAHQDVIPNRRHHLHGQSLFHPRRIRHHRERSRPGRQSQIPPPGSHGFAQHPRGRRGILRARGKTRYPMEQRGDRRVTPRDENTTGDRGTHGGECCGDLLFHAFARGTFEECVGGE